MGRYYSEDVLDVAIKHAGRELLLEAAGSVSNEEARFSAGFEKRMQSVINGEIRKRRTSKALKILSRVAAAMLIVIVVSTAVVFSSEALRAEVFNMFANIGKGSVDIGAQLGSNSVPEGMAVPGYLPEGFRLTEAEKVGLYTFVSGYKDLSGNMITIKQYKADNLDLGIDNDGKAYETDISGVKVIAADNIDNIIAAFVYKEYAYTIGTFSEVELSELLKIAQSIINQ